MNLAITDKITQSFASQTFMKMIGANLLIIKEGFVEIGLPFNDAALQQNGFTHGAAIAAIADTACGYAAISLAGENEDMLTLEYKINFLRPATGKHFTASAKIIQDGKRIKTATCEVVNNEAKLIAIMTATLIVAVP